MLLQTVTATLAGAITSLGQMAMWSSLFGGGHDDEEGGSPAGGLLMMVLAPVAAGLIQMAISRQREFKADQVGAEISGVRSRWPGRCAGWTSTRTASPWTSLPPRRRSRR
jgi:heat shock protein HtpX